MFKKLLGERNYFFKSFLPAVDGWAVLCGTFSVLFILSQANFDLGFTYKFFLISWFIPVFIMASLGILTNGGFRIFFKINIEHKDAFVINTFVLNNHVDTNISDENLKELFYYLKKGDSIGSFKTFIYSFFVTIFSTSLAFVSNASFYDVTVIFFGGTFSGILLGLFTFFSAGKFTSNFLRECREMMKTRGIKPNEKIQQSSLKIVFYYFIILFIMMLFVVLSFVEKLTPLILASVFVSFIMITIVIKILFSYVVSIFQEIKDFSNKLPHGEKIEYFTGSSYKEVLELSENLTASAAKIYEAREVEKSARIKLEELDKVKDEFITTAAHQLRTPLSATRWALKSSIDGTFQGKEQKELLQKIYDTNNNLINIVGDLLDTSSIENKTFAYDFQEQDISLLLKEVVSSSIFQLKDKKINVNYHEPEDHKTFLKFDKDKLSMALQNIVSNAVDYTPDGGNIDVTLKKENNQIIIEIQDTGIGIPTEAQAHVFEKFYRGDNAKKTETDRSGLGLYISKQIIEKHGGTISVESKEGEGTKVVVRLGLLATARS